MQVPERWQYVVDCCLMKPGGSYETHKLPPVQYGTVPLLTLFFLPRGITFA